jgi:hypothetical protein
MRSREDWDTCRPSFFTIIPSEVRWCRTIESEAKLLYGDIASCCCIRGYCDASYKYLASLFDTEIENVKRWLKSLKEHKFIYIDSGEVYIRIYVNKESKKKFEDLKKQEKRRLQVESVVLADIKPPEDGDYMSQYLRY